MIADLKSLIMYKNYQTSGWIPLSLILYKKEINSPASTTEVSNDQHYKSLIISHCSLKKLEHQLLVATALLGEKTRAGSLLVHIAC